VVFKFGLLEVKDNGRDLKIFGAGEPAQVTVELHTFIKPAVVAIILAVLCAKRLFMDQDGMIGELSTADVGGSVTTHTLNQTATMTVTEIYKCTVKADTQCDTMTEVRITALANICAQPTPKAKPRLAVYTV
jgi:uncharacterized membrane protein